MKVQITHVDDGIASEKSLRLWVGGRKRVLGQGEDLVVVLPSNIRVDLLLEAHPAEAVTIEEPKA